ncbi:5-(carboxyamino)imidazole ribonucleotide synthase [soil metagenome]
MLYRNGLKLGILGGGQLGRMLIQSGINYNLHHRVLDPDAQAPCKNIADEFANGKLTNYDAVYHFGKQCDVITIEIENVNCEALKQLEKEGIPVYPQPHIIELIQDKGLQKQFYAEHNIPTAPFTFVEHPHEISERWTKFPCIVKLRREGYDGRGVMKLNSAADIATAFDKPSIIEELIPFEKELAVIVHRNIGGEMRTFPVVEMDFHPEKNLVEFLFCPANINWEIAKKAGDIAKKVAEKLGIVGTLAVEMFLTKEGEILVNEVAPRVHNSGHHTIEGNVTSQFDQHLRAILGMPLGNTHVKQPAVMVNLLGEEGHTGPAAYKGLKEVLELDGVSIHLYGKQTTKPFRKMGHVTITDPDLQTARKRAKQVKETLKVIAQ